MARRRYLRSGPCLFLTAKKNTRLFREKLGHGHTRQRALLKSAERITRRKWFQNLVIIGVGWDLTTGAGNACNVGYARALLLARHPAFSAALPRRRRYRYHQEEGARPRPSARRSFFASRSFLSSSVGKRPQSERRERAARSSSFSN